jgi:DNA-binding MarR family transcriptional regulator/GNAT superfamily N-acetyltransferase
MTTLPRPPGTRQIAAMRRFNRFYTRQIGVLDRGFLESRFSLTEVRVLYELSARGRATAAELVRDLGLDAGYLSRLLRGFRARKLVSIESSPTDGRRSILQLTAHGRKVFAALEARQVDAVRQTLRGLADHERRNVVAAMRTIEAALGKPADEALPCVLRPPRAGELGWVIHRHGLLYNHEYGWDETFEALVAGIVAGFVRTFDPRRERCWIAERGGEVVGSVFCVKKTRAVARLRLLYVEPAARGLGIGQRLVDECVGFARRAGYRRMTLWTNDVLHAARAIYERTGFRLVDEEPHHSYGRDLVAQTWEMDL